MEYSYTADIITASALVTCQSLKQELEDSSISASS